jgi:hypothetical protein
VNLVIEKTGAAGDLRDLNAAFKEARKADPSIRSIIDFPQIEALAAE